MSEVALGAAGNAGILYYVFVLVGMGFTVGTQIIIGRRNGEKKYGKIGTLVNHTAGFILLYAALVFLFLKFSISHFLPAIVESNNIADSISIYLKERSWGVFFTLGNLVFVSFFVGITKTKILGIITPIVAILNVFLDYSLIYGHYGFPRLEIEGAAFASNISEGIGFAAMFIYALTYKDKARFNLFVYAKIQFKVIQKIFVTAGPIMLQNFVTLGSWFVFFVLIESLGERELAISHIVRNIYMIAMIPIFGFGDATSTMVSNLMGEGGQKKIKSLVKKIMILGMISNAIVYPFLMFIPEKILYWYTNNDVLMMQAIPIVKLIAHTTFIFTAGVVFFRAIVGIGRTVASLYIELGSIFSYLLYVYMVTKIYPSSLVTVWSSEFIYFGFLTIISLLYLRLADWHDTNI